MLIKIYYIDFENNFNINNMSISEETNKMKIVVK